MADKIRHTASALWARRRTIGNLIATGAALDSVWLIATGHYLSRLDAVWPALYAWAVVARMGRDG